MAVAFTEQSNLKAAIERIGMIVCCHDSGHANTINNLIHFHFTCHSHAQVSKAIQIRKSPFMYT